MCEPVSTGMLLQMSLGTASAAASHYAGNQQADYRDKLHEQNIERSMQAYRDQTHQEQTRLIQEDKAAAQDVQEANLRQRKAAGEALASQNSPAVDVESLLYDYRRSDGEYRDAAQRQLDWKRQQSGYNMKGYQANMKNRIASTQPNPADRPSLPGTFVNAGISAADTYTTHQMNNRSRKGTGGGRYE